MTGRAEIERKKQVLDATFDRASSIKTDPELLSDFARYLCVLVAGFLEQSIIEIVLDHVRTHSASSVQQHVEQRVRRFTNAKVQRVIQLIGSFDADWRRELEGYLVDEHRAAVDSVVELRHAIAHGRPADVISMVRIRDYYGRVKQVVDHIADLCAPN
jgi:RiboL-PSP-HEPN